MNRETRSLADGWLLVSPADAGRLALLVRAGVAAFRQQRNLNPAAADLVMAVEQAAYAARRAAGGTVTTSLRPQAGESSVTVPEAAQMLQVSSSYVRRLCRAEVLDARRDGRDWLINADSLAAYALARGQAA